ncbi:hypothetical protein EYF80_039744 [Liparis tanakae]|uniref:Uncharacterized protein n=1 Tax=Liparis tanakae TaxID=230148 RepID=A0A4Z2G946_9TELE|nr:hypothetical protein EYF80_039744 [Liparis tanakae]
MQKHTGTTERTPRGRMRGAGGRAALPSPRQVHCVPDCRDSGRQAGGRTASTARRLDLPPVPFGGVLVTSPRASGGPPPTYCRGPLQHYTVGHMFGVQRQRGNMSQQPGAELQARGAGGRRAAHGHQRDRHSDRGLGSQAGDSDSM